MSSRHIEMRTGAAPNFTPTRCGIGFDIALDALVVNPDGTPRTIVTSVTLGLAGGNVGDLLLSDGAGAATFNAPEALTKADDTNVTLTLGGSASTALVNAASVTAGWTGTLSLARGGTAATLTAAAGAVPYSTASALALTAVGSSGQVLTSAGTASPTWETPATGTVTSVAATAPTGLSISGSPITSAGTLAFSLTSGYMIPGGGSSGQVLQSQGASAPAFSTATYPTTVAANRLLYASGPDAVGDLATANSGVLVTSGAGVPSVGTDIPTGVTIGSAYIYRAGGTAVPLTDGGTNASLTAVNGGVAYSTASALALSVAGTSGQVLTSAGAAAPTWTTPTTGTVTSVATTVPSLMAISGSPITASGTLAVTWDGTANCIPYFSGATTLATDAGFVFDGTNFGVGQSTPAYFVHFQHDQNATTQVVLQNDTADTTAVVAYRIQASDATGFFGAAPSTYTILPILAQRAVLMSGAAAIGQSDTLGVSIVAAYATADIRFFAGGFTATEERLRIDSAGQLIVGGDTGTTGEVLTAVTGGSPVWSPPATAGTVTSVAQTVPSLMAISGSPVTSSGTLALTWDATANGVPYFSTTTTLACSSAMTFDGTTFKVGDATDYTGMSDTAFTLATSSASFSMSISTSNVSIQQLTGAGMYWRVATGGTLNFQNGAGTTKLRFNDSTGYFGFGTTSPVAQLHTQHTSVPFRAGYDASNYMTLAVSSAGAVTLNAVGASSSFVFSDAVAVNAAFGCNSATPQTAYASGGALSAYAAGANGLDSGANMSALHALVVSMRAALVANGVMS